jgi:hypothetical protein
MQVSVPTLQKMEKGDPTVSIGVYASALWLIGRVQFLGTIADPAADETALVLELELRNLPTACATLQNLGYRICERY